VVCARGTSYPGLSSVRARRWLAGGGIRNGTSAEISGHRHRLAGRGYRNLYSMEKPEATASPHFRIRSAMAWQARVRVGRRAISCISLRTRLPRPPQYTGGLAVWRGSPYPSEFDLSMVSHIDDSPTAASLLMRSGLWGSACLTPICVLDRVLMFDDGVASCVFFHQILWLVGLFSRGRCARPLLAPELYSLDFSCFPIPHGGAPPTLVAVPESVSG